MRVRVRGRVRGRERGRVRLRAKAGPRVGVGARARVGPRVGCVLGSAPVGVAGEPVEPPPAVERLDRPLSWGRLLPGPVWNSEHGLVEGVEQPEGGFVGALVGVKDRARVGVKVRGRYGEGQIGSEMGFGFGFGFGLGLGLGLPWAAAAAAASGTGRRSGACRGSTRLWSTACTASRRASSRTLYKARRKRVSG